MQSAGATWHPSPRQVLLSLVVAVTVAALGPVQRKPADLRPVASPVHAGSTLRWAAAIRLIAALPGRHAADLFNASLTPPPLLTT